MTGGKAECRAINYKRTVISKKMTRKPKFCRTNHLILLSELLYTGDRTDYESALFLGEGL